MAVGAAPAFAQGGSTSTISGTVTDTIGRGRPRRGHRDQERRHQHDLHRRERRRRLVHDPGDAARHLHRHGDADGLQDRRPERRASPTWRQVADGEGRARARRSSRRRSSCRGATGDRADAGRPRWPRRWARKQIASLPVVGRGAFDLVGHMPGVATHAPAASRDATVNGLPQSAVNITLDGMNIQDNYAKSWDGMFTRVSPRLDAVEEVTVSTAAQGADMGSQGAVQVRFVTRSGTNQFQGSAYYYFRRDWMNTNTWFNEPQRRRGDRQADRQAEARTRTSPGVRIGGPILKDKAFFFVNYEWISSPGTAHGQPHDHEPALRAGDLPVRRAARWTCWRSPRRTATRRPSTRSIAKLLADVRSTTSQGDGDDDDRPARRRRFAWQQPTESTTTYPTVRLDYNLTSKHRLTGSGTYNHLVSDPDTTNSMQRDLPGLPRARDAGLGALLLRSSRCGPRSPRTWSTRCASAAPAARRSSPRPRDDMYSNASFGDMTAATRSSGATSRASATRTRSTPNSSREGSTKVIEDTLNWLKGKHALTIGGSATRGDVWLKNQRLVPTAHPRHRHRRPGRRDVHDRELPRARRAPT